MENHLYLLLYLAGEAPQRVFFDLSSARISQIGAETDENGKIRRLGGTLHRNSLDRPNHKKTVSGIRRRISELASR